MEGGPITGGRSLLDPSSGVAARASFALNAGEKFRRFTMVVRSSHLRRVHLTTLSDFSGPLQRPDNVVQNRSFFETENDVGCLKCHVKQKKSMHYVSKLI